MTNVAIAATTAVKTTVCLTWTDAQIVRITANKDLPEFGVRAKQTVYLIRSNSLNEGHEGEGTWYHIIVWGDRKATGWSCSCKGFEVYGKCRHCVLSNVHSRERAKRIATQKASQEQAKRQRWISYNVAGFYEALYVYAIQQVAQGESIQVVAANKDVKSLAKVAPKQPDTKGNASLSGRNFKLINGVPMR